MPLKPLLCVAPGEEFEVVQREVADLLKGRILVGHALHNDLKVSARASVPHGIGGAARSESRGRGCRPARRQPPLLRAEPLPRRGHPGPCSLETPGSPRLTGWPLTASTVGGRPAPRAPSCPRGWGSACAQQVSAAGHSGPLVGMGSLGWQVLSARRPQGSGSPFSACALPALVTWAALPSTLLGLSQGRGGTRFIPDTLCVCDTNSSTGQTVTGSLVTESPPSPPLRLFPSVVLCCAPPAPR